MTERDIVSASHGLHQLNSGQIDRLDQIAREVAHFATMAATSKIFAGRALLEARALFPSDQQFGAWREEVLPGLHRQVALEYMQVAREYGDRPQFVEALSMRALRALSAPSMPQSVRDEVEAKVGAGESVTAAEIDRLKREAAEAAKRAQEADAKADDATAEANRQRAKADALAEGQRDLIEAAKEQARKDAEAKAADDLEKSRGEASRAKSALSEQQRQLADATRKAEAAAMAKAQAEAENLAAAELEKVQAALQKARKEESETRKVCDRLSENIARMSANVKKYEDALSKMKGADLEAASLRGRLEEVVRVIAMAMGDVLDLEHEHGPEVHRKIAQTSDTCRKFAEALNALGGPRLVYDADFAQS